MDLANLTLRELTAGFAVRDDSRRRSEYPGADAATRRRCRTPEHGAALLIIGHAIEYLLDSQIAKRGTPNLAEREALAILLTANLAVYREGTEVISLADRLRHWFRGGRKKDVAGVIA